MLKIGLSVGAAAFDPAKLSAIKSAGIDSVEVGYGKYYKFKDFDYKLLRKYADEVGLEVWSLHLPFSPFGALDPSSKDRVKREFTYDHFCNIIEKATDVGIDKFVVHPSAEPNLAKERAEKLDIAADFFNSLADFAANRGAVIALEDLPRTCLGNCSDELLYIMKANDKLRVCYDTNHLLGEAPLDFIKKMGSKIVTLHVSDYDFINERHWLPGEGDNDWQAVYSALSDVGYNGVWMYEVGLLPPKTIERRPIGYSDIYNNAIEIMSGKKPTPIGKRIILG